MATTRHETREAALVRLAARARETGVVLKRDDRGRYWASSTSQAGHWHAVTGYSCDCPGFVGHGRCKHYAALLAALGWLDGDRDPEPEPAPIALPIAQPCTACGGRGDHLATVATGPTTWVYTSVGCAVCRGAGVASGDDRRERIAA